MRYAFIARHRAVWPTRTMCRVLRASPSGFYDWLERSPCKRVRDDQRLLGMIRTSFQGSDRTYGSPRVHDDLRDWGERCGENRVARLMRQGQLRARAKRRRPPLDPGIRPEHFIAPNLLDREFEASAPNQKWVADFTYIATAKAGCTWRWCWICLAANRRLVDAAHHDCAARPGCLADGAVAAGQADRAAASLRPGQPVHERGLPATVGRSGDHLQHEPQGRLWDNAAMESFFSSLKHERVSRRRYRTRDEARADLFDYIERFYNPRRRHSRLGNVSPMEYELRFTS